MLTITVIGEEIYDEVTEKFSSTGDIVISLEHSLVSLSKWESKHQKPFLGPSEKSTEDVLDYIRCMIITPDFPKDIISRLSQDNISEINSYIESKESATTFGEMPQTRPSRNETITSELIYYWMVAFNIPFVCETWHINRLFSLIRICNVKQSKQKKLPKNEVAQRNRDLNAQRRAQLGTSG